MNCDRPLNAKKWGSKQRAEAGWGQSGAPARAFPLHCAAFHCGLDGEVFCLRAILLSWKEVWGAACSSH